MLRWSSRRDPSLLTSMTADPHLPAPLPDSLGFSPSREIASWVGHLALATTWCVRHPMEPFAEHAKGSALEPVYYRAADGWEAPLWRLPPRPGASGEPIVLGHALGSSLRVMDWSPESSLVRRLHRLGFDVYLFEHRGDPSARPPVRPGPADLDAIIAEDIRGPRAGPRAERLPADALARPWLRRSGSPTPPVPRRLFGPRGRGDGRRARPIRAGCEPGAAGRRALRLLPPASGSPPADPGLRAAVPRGAQEHGLSKDTSGPRARGLMVQGVADLSTGLLRQAARWIESGTLCDREDWSTTWPPSRASGSPSLASPPTRTPLPSWAAGPPWTRWRPRTWSGWRLDDTWGHLDPLVGERAEFGGHACAGGLPRPATASLSGAPRARGSCSGRHAA